MGLARAAARLMKGRSAEAVRRAGEASVDRLIDLVQPWALEALGAHRAEGRLIVLATTSPEDLVAGFARALDFDDVIATRYEEIDGRYTGRLDGRFVWGLGKRDAAREWAGVERRRPGRLPRLLGQLLRRAPARRRRASPTRSTPTPRLVAVALARRWPLEYWDRPPGVPSVVGLEPYHLLRPLVRPESFPYARFNITGVEHIPARARSSWSPTTAATSTWPPSPSWPPGSVGRCGSWASRSCSTPRWSASWHGRSAASPSIGRPGRASRCAEAAAALRAGEVRHRPAPGHHPPGRAVLRSRPDRARPGRPAWPPRPGRRSSPSGCGAPRRSGPARPRCPNVATLQHPPRVTVTGRARRSPLGRTDAVADTATLMAAIAALLPAEARLRHIPTAEELAPTRPSA